MAVNNNIELFKQYIPLLDKVYKEASLTAALDGNAELARAGANANEMVIPMLSMDGLADYSRNSGYVDGDVDLTYETVACNYDRGRMFTVDTLDNIETALIAFGQLSSEFIRTKVVPEVDAFRFAEYAQKAGTAVAETLETGADVVTALRACANAMDEDEVPATDRFLYITPSLHSLIDDLDTTKSRAVLAKFGTIVDVPQTRFYDKITLAGSGNGGFAKAEDGVELNFICIHKDAVIQFPKHIVNKVITPEANQTSDGWKFGYRNVGIADVYENKTAGIYVSKAEGGTSL